jgi:hypothetical protein
MLHAACRKLRLWADIQERPSTGQWRTNTAIKPTYIREMLDKHEHVLWLDCDGLLHQYPLMCAVQPPDVDIMACPHRTWKGEKRDWHVGIMSIRSNERTKAFMDAWIKQVNDNAEHDVTDEFAFIQLMKAHPDVKFQALPDTYHVIAPGRSIPSGAVWSLGISQDVDKQLTYRSKDRLEYL